MMAKAELWCRVTIVGPGDLELGAFALKGPGDPDVGAVDDVARFVLLAKRLGGRLVLTDLSTKLRELLDLAGLPAELAGPCVEVAGLCVEEVLSVEVERQTELGEEPRGIQEGEEERRGADLAP
jgi:hypothetical protein